MGRRKEIRISRKLTSVIYSIGFVKVRLHHGRDISLVGSLHQGLRDSSCQGQSQSTPDMTIVPSMASMSPQFTATVHLNRRLNLRAPESGSATLEFRS
jgi:hypothetical protein